MGSSHTRNSTRRAPKTRSVNPARGPSHKSTPSVARTRHTSKPNAATRRYGYVLQLADKLPGKGDTVEAPPTETPQKVSVILQAKLQGILDGIRVARDAAYVAGVAIRSQNADSDVEVATVLQRCVGDELDLQIEVVEVLLAWKLLS